MDIEDQRTAWRDAHPKYLLPDGTIDIDLLCKVPIPDNQPRKMWVPMSLDTGALLEP